MIHNILLISGYIKVIQLTYIFFQILFQYRLLQDIEYSSLCYTVNLYSLSILYASVNPIFLIYPPLLSPLVTKFIFYVWVYFCFINKFICIIFRFHIYEIKWYLSFSVWLGLLSMITSSWIHVAAIFSLFHSFLWLSSIHIYLYICIYIFFIRSSVDGHVCCFHVLAAVSSAAMNAREYAFFWIIVLSG